MTCQQWNEQLKQWLERRWPDRGAPECPPVLRRHADDCPRCRARLEAALLLLEGGALEPSCPPGLVERIIAGLQQQNRAARRIRPFSFALPAAAVLLIALGLVFLLRMPDRSVPDTVIVRFQLHAPDAGQVSVVGNWNRWDPQAQKLEDPDGDGVWEIEIPLKRDEEHQYQFLIDGQRWIPDPGAALQVDDGFGGVNSVLQI